MEGNSLFWYVFWAAIGGAFVLIGIVVEELADKHWYKSQKSLECWNRVKFWGIWGGVVFGVFIEVVVAGFTAVSEFRNEPLNQPVSTVEAMAQVAINSPVFPQPRPLMFNNSSLDLTGTNIGTGTPFFGLTLRTFPLVMGINGFQYGKSNAVAIGMQFQEYGTAPLMMLDASNNIINLPRPTVKEVLDETKAMYFYIDFIPTNSEVLGGQTILRVNGFEKTFRIPKQGPIPWAGTVPPQTDGNGIGFFATNAP